jgi:hypothetical protein
MDLLRPAGGVGLVYPFAVGTCILVFSLYSLLILREKIGRAGIFGLILGGAGMVLLTARLS